MWGKVVEEIRRAGPRKVAIIAVVAVIAVIFAYGNNSTNDAANGMTLPKGSSLKALAVTAHRAPTRALRSPRTVGR